MATRQQVSDHAMELSSEERQRLIHELALSLEADSPPDASTAEVAWRSEIARRARRLRDGSAELVDGTAELEQMIAELKPRDRTK